MEQEQGSAWRHLLMTLISVAGMAVMVWMELPEGQRSMLTLELRAGLHKHLHAAAQRLGHSGMGSELAAHMPTARASYGLAYRLARWRDQV
jgi:hypothetical protein